MSGYDPETNTFELTATKAGYWFRRTSGFPPDTICECCGAFRVDIWTLYKRCLEHYGVEILKDGGGYLVCRGTPEMIWEALSGQPSDPSRAAHYYNGPGRAK